MRNYRRIEINAFQRRVTVVSGKCPRDGFNLPLAQSINEVSLNDIEVAVPIAPDSTEGQLILIEAVRSLERRLLPEARAVLYAETEILTPTKSSRNGLYLKLQSLCQFIWPGTQPITPREE